MAPETCSSSSSSIQKWCYDAFVSFHGEDTRKSFTDHLFAALYRSGISTFRDDRELERGKAIWPELENAIMTSRIAVIVFSKNYVASIWCLDELEKIMERNRSLQQIVLPIFYHVDPSELQAQTGLAEVFAKHKELFGEEKVRRWRADLTEAANLAGWDSQNDANGFESELIEKIIGDISNKLNREYFMVAPYPVGLESRMQNLHKLLNRGPSDVRMVGIWGIGGIGKTTIAKAIYNLLQTKFEGSCFLENVREYAKQPNGLLVLQEQILLSFHVTANRKVKLVDQGTMVIKNRAWCKRVLVVLDDVDHHDQLDKLAIRRGYFQPGSIIIITTRDKSMLKLAEVDETYMPPALDYHESIKLLSWHAFGKDHPNKNYAEFSKEVIYYTGGLPLALKVLGSFLTDKSTNEWEGALKKLKVMPPDEIQEKLLVSFCSLSDTQKELFLDIACFFVGMRKNDTFKILQDSNLFLESELGVLVRRCLVTIDCSNRLRMHDMIRDMGREVVRKQSPKLPGERSRLWFHEDVLDVLKYHTGTEVVEGIMLNLPQVHDLRVDSRALAKMHQLRVLQLNYASLKGNFQCPSKRLRYLEWYGFPLKTIPSDLYMENLVAVYMPYSSLIELWTGTKILQKLKFVDVSHSYRLRRTPDFSGITNLEVLVLNCCTSLVEVHKSVTCLDKLVTLDLADCKNLTKLPLGIKSHVNLSGCTKLDMSPRFEFKSPLTLRYSLLISSEVPLRSCGFISKLLQHKDFTIGGDGGIIVTATSRVQGKRRHSKSAAGHHPQPPLKEQAAFTECHDMPIICRLANEQYTLTLDVENCGNTFGTIQETIPEISELVAQHGLMTRIQHPNGTLFRVLLVQSRDTLYSFPRAPTTSFAPFHLPFISTFFLQQLTILNVSLCRRFQSLDELPIGLQAMGANNASSLEWILTGSNLKLSEQLINIGCSKLLNKNPTSIPRNKELIALDSFSVFLPGIEFPDWFDFQSMGSILSFVVPPLEKQKIRGWFVCVVFASRFHDIHGFTVICKFKNNTKDTEWHYQQKNCRVIPCQEHLWLHSVPLHHVAHLLEAGDEVEYSIQLSGSFQLKKFGVNLIYENDKNYQSYFEAMIQNASLPHKKDILDEDVSTDQAMAGDNEVHPSNVQMQMSRFGDKRKGIATCLDASKGRRCLSAQEAAQQQLDEELAARLQDEEDVTTSWHCELNTALVKVEDQSSEGNRQRGWPYLHENPQGAMLFEGRAPFEQNMYLSGIPTMNSMSQTEHLRSRESERMLWEAERQLLHHQLGNEQRAHWASCEDAARASQQLRVQNAALESENIRLRMALAHATRPGKI